MSAGDVRRLWEAGQRDKALAAARAALGSDAEHQREMIEALRPLTMSAAHEPDPRVEEAQRLEIALCEARHDPELFEAWRALALHLGRIGRYDDAVAAARHGLAVAEQSSDRPHVAAAWRLLGYLAKNAGRLDDAEPAYDRALAEQDPDADMTLGGLLDIYIRQGRWADAERAHKRLHTLRRWSGGFDKAIWWHRLADLQLRQGHLAEAVESARKAFEQAERASGVGPGDVGAMARALADLLAQEGERAEALVVTRRALELLRRARGATDPDVLALEARVEAMENAPPPAGAPATATTWPAPGARVRHATFGDGVVTAAGVDTVSVQFADGKMRRLSRRHAKLEPAQ